MKNESKTMKNKSMTATVLMGLFALVGCAYNNGQEYPAEQQMGMAYDAQCADGICTSNQEYTAVCVENADGYSDCHDATPVNYTRTAADFRAYGERTPRDHRITQAGAGNNISAAIPPSIDNEVVYYENNLAPTQANNTQIPAGTKEVYNAQGQQVPIPIVYTNSGQPVVAPNPPVYTSNGQQVPPSTPVVYTPAGLPVLSPVQPQQANNDDDGDLVKDWLAEEGQSLKDLLTQWSDDAGWRLIWKTNRNYTLNAGAMFRGTFADVSSALVRAFARARPAPIATFYKGNRVLVIETMEDENAYD